MFQYDYASIFFCRPFHSYKVLSDCLSVKLEVTYMHMNSSENLTGCRGIAFCGNTWSMLWSNFEAEFKTKEMLSVYELNLWLSHWLDKLNAGKVIFNLSFIYSKCYEHRMIISDSMNT